ncbi:MAG: ice-binding family protein [Ilumatobacteraceae bacterium]
MFTKSVIKRFSIVWIVPLLLVVSLDTTDVNAYVSPAGVDLGTAANFSVLGNTSISNVNSVGTVVTGGNVGSGPTGFSVSNFPPGTVTAPGILYTAANAATANANTALGLAYTSIAGRSVNQTFPNGDGQLNNLTLAAGVYRVGSATTAQLTAGNLTLDGENNPNAIWIFQIPGTSLTTAASTKILLTRQAQACNVYWQVGSSATLGASSTFVGNILADTSITVGTSATVNGRLLAGAVTTSGAISLDANPITTTACLAKAAPLPPLISIVKVPNPPALPLGPGLVTYTYTVRNIGPVTMTNVTVSDNKCAPLALISGDTNANNYLETTETWTVRCTTLITETTTNAATAVGFSGGLSSTDVAFATVVLTPLPPPLINVVKTPNRFILPFGGGSVTYTYTVTNPGVVAIGNVAIADNLCKAISARSGDLNDNNLLDLTETWLYACTMKITSTTLNTVTVTGSSNGLTATDIAFATVVVAAPVASTIATPGFPNTGIGPDDQNTPWNVITLVVLIPALLLITRARRKQTS